MLRLLHTSDWHLGHGLHDLSREAEHAAFLSWLMDQLEATEADALLVCGDVFHTANPSASATSQWYDFLAELRDRFPDLDVIAIAGNHDSAGRIEAPEPLLPPRHTIIGRTHRTDDGALDLSRMVVPVHDKSGAVAAWVLAVPFLRPQDLPPDQDTHGAEYLVAGTRKVYGALVELARERADAGQAVIAMGHMHMVAATVSEGSERRVFGGAEHVPADAFPDDIAYVALGHLHKPQRVNKDTRIRYSGSPIPLSMDEENYPHQVLRVDVDGRALVAVESVRIPRSVEVLRLPRSGPCTPGELAAHLAALPDADAQAGPSATWPYLEVRVVLDQPTPSLRADVEQALTGKAVRLVRIAVSYPERPATADADVPARDLSELDDPSGLFTRMWTDKHGSDPDEPVMTALHELIDAATRDAEDAG